MTSVEAALAGLALLGAVMTITWVTAARRGDSKLVARLWSLWLPLAAGVYLLCAEGPSLKQVITLALVLSWGAATLVYAPTQRGDVRGFAVSYLSRQVGGVFLASASLLPLLTDFSAPLVYWLDVPAAILSLAGLGLVTGKLSVARLPRRLWPYLQEPGNAGQLLFWTGIYLGAVSVPSGYLTLFAPLIVYRHYRALGQVGSQVVATGTPAVTATETFTTQAQWPHTGS
jgi:steroid 5-alpha reductase family enzyme